jgi:hypothetical protein
MENSTIKKLDEIENKLYILNATISGLFVTGIKKPTQEDMTKINQAIGQIIKEIRKIKDEKN